MYIELINNPMDLKKLSIEECVKLADEIRTALLNTISKTGGHLSSNLGIIETTIALHYIFDSPKDKIIFDTAHQCYTHKILTGRKDAYLQMERYNKYSGYTNPDESEHDLFKFGHTSTSISLACGVAKARNLKGGKENVIAVIGDASLGGGQALEALNYAGAEIEGNFIIILNDNQMSIAENHGALYNVLRDLRNSKGTCQNNLFKDMGYNYVFVENGNDVRELIPVMNNIKNSNHPVVVHICTTKGYGYSSAENNKELSHFVKPFNIDAGIQPNKIEGERYDIIVRDYLLERMKTDPTLVVMTAAVPVALSFGPKERALAGKQYVDVGIAEQMGISMAAGIAKNGGTPVFCTRSTFYQRAYDQISQEVCINKLPVTMIVVNASIYSPTDMTHIGIFDIPFMSNIPNLVYLAPANKQEYLSMLEWSLEQRKYPVAIRAPRNGVYYSQEAVDTDYGVINKYKTVTKGEHIAIIALGDFFQMGEELADKIKTKLHINATLINPRYITGIDNELLEELENKHSLIVTLEDGVLDGGFGQKIAGFYGKTTMKVLNYGFEKEFFDCYNVQEVMKKNRLNPDMILEDIMKIML